MAEIRIETLREHAGTYRLHAYCPHCRHEAWLNLMRLAQAAGWDAEVSAIRRALRCSICGARGPELRKIHDGRPAAILSRQLSDSENSCGPTSPHRER